MSTDTTPPPPSVPPGYKQTEVGVIPVEWEVKPLIDLCLPQGLVRGPFGGSLKKDSFVESGFRVYEQRNAIYKSCDIGTYFIDRSKFNEMQRFQVKPGDFIISCSGTIGRIYQIPSGADPGIINQALLKISTDSDIVHDRFFYLTFEWDKFQERIIDSTQGGAMQNLVGMDIFKTTPVILPPPPEQRAIAAALADVDGLITALDRLIAKKRAIKQATMQQLLTGKTRLPGFAGAWETKRLGDILTVRHGRSQAQVASDAGDYPILGTSGIIGRAHTYLWDQPSVLIGRKGTIDHPQYMDSPFWTIDTLFYTTINDTEDAKFLYYRFCIIDWQSLNEASGVPSLSSSNIERQTFERPPLPEQAAIAAALSDMDAEIAALEQRRDKTQAIKQGMMQQLLTGRVRLMANG